MAVMALNGEILLALFLIGVIAFFVKGVIGTGPTTVIVALGSLIIAPKDTVVLSSLVNIFGGIAMLPVEPVPIKRRFWCTVAGTMILGSIVGAAALKYIPSLYFEMVLGGAFFLCSLWFLIRVPSPQNGTNNPPRANSMDLIVGAFSGFCGGFIGINAPPLILHFGKLLSKSYLRRLLVLIFLPAAVAQSATFYINGMLTKEIFLFSIAMLPAMALGIPLGNFAFHRSSEVLYRRILGAVLMIMSGHTMWKALF